MKKSFLLLISSIFLFTISCKNTPKESTASVSGIIQNSDEKYVLLESMESIISHADTAYLDKSGNFNFKIQINEPEYFYIRFGNERAKIFVSPGDDLKITADIKAFDSTLNITGTGEKVNNYLVKKMKLWNSLDDNKNSLFSLDEKAFIKSLDSIKDIKASFTNDFINKEKLLNKKFKKYERASIEYDNGLTRLQFSQYFSYYNENKTLSSEYNDYQKNLKLEDNTLLGLSQYRKYINNFIRSKADEMIQNDTSLQYKANAYTEAIISASQNIIKDKNLLDFMLYSTMKEQYTYNGTKGTDHLFELFNENCNNEEFKTDIKKLFDSWSTIAPGNLAFDFKYPDIKGDAHSLSDYKGKYVYVDVWATWCGPCKAEIPSFKKLVEKFKGKNVVFISVSVDENKSDWENMLNEQQFSWIQLYAGGWNSSICKDYIIHSIPRFLLIDQDGKILDAEAPRPSSGIEKVLNGLKGI